MGLFVAGCDTTPRVENEPNPDATTTAETPALQRTDGMITTSIQAKYFASSDVKAHRIDVDTNDGVVTLNGSVDTDAERTSAEQIARGVEGVTRIENKLAVRPAVSDRADAQQHHAPDNPAFDRDGRSPAWVTTKVQSQFFLNPELKPWRIDVDTSAAGVVTLTGRVDSEGDRAEAVRIARSTEGVTRVNDNLRVEPQSVATTGTPGETARDARTEARDTANRAGGKIEDAWITTKIQSKFFVDDDVRARNIDVDTKDGMVTLKGSVQSEGERHQAVAIAKNTDGVTMVHDNLVVDRGTSNMSRDAGPRGTATAASKVDDAWITMKVQSKYFIHDDIKSRDVNVDTKNGVVTLKGTVASEVAKNAAEEIAQDTDGVTKVVNTLRVEG
jgi:osmotically-inducible protein OsmY